MDEGIDRVKFYLKKFDISSNDDAQSLYNKMANNALQQIEEFLPQLEKNYQTIKQNDEVPISGENELKLMVE